MDGLLVIDKPAGPTSHDVVARARRLLREKRVGHTGTLDPLATGVLPLVVGRATRLARFLSASDKAYEAVIVLGFATDTGDATGAPLHGDGAPLSGDGAPPASSVPTRSSCVPTRDAIDEALQAFRGTFLQQPPVYSAKKIGGRRSYDLAREAPSPAASSVPIPSSSVPAAELRPQPVAVTTHRLEIAGVDGNRVTVNIDCSAGFYVRSLAHDLGQRLGTGAHLAELRRTRSGDYSLADALALDHAERDPTAAASRLIPLSGMLPRLPAVALTADDVRRARNGQNLPGGLSGPGSPYVRLMDAAGDLIGIAEPAGVPGLLHPFVVLG